MDVNIIVLWRPEKERYLQLNLKVTYFQSKCEIGPNIWIFFIAYFRSRLTQPKVTTMIFHCGQETNQEEGGGGGSRKLKCPFCLTKCRKGRHCLCPHRGRKKHREEPSFQADKFTRVRRRLEPMSQSLLKSPEETSQDGTTTEPEAVEEESVAQKVWKFLAECPTFFYRGFRRSQGYQPQERRQIRFFERQTKVQCNTSFWKTMRRTTKGPASLRSWSVYGRMCRHQDSIGSTFSKNKLKWSAYKWSQEEMSRNLMSNKKAPHPYKSIVLKSGENYGGKSHFL